MSEQQQVRRDKRARMIGTGREPYPVDMHRTHTLSEVRAGWPDLDKGEETQDVVEIGGRVVFLRNTGKLCFATLQDGFSQDSSGERLQVMISLAEVGEQALADWKADVDLGDFVWVRGRVISSRRGELSVMASEWKIASKALRPLPALHKELSEESRVRQRYADLIVRPEARDMVRLRAAITRSLRETLDSEGFLEVETPTLQLIHGGAAARPFNTHLNAFDTDMTLRIALELYLKRVMVGGIDAVYEIGRIFRNEGIDSTHSAEFTMLEAYQSWGDDKTIAALTKEMIMNAADVAGVHQIERSDGRVIDLDAEWRWLPIYDAVSDAVGEVVDVDTSIQHLHELCEAREVEFDPKWGNGKLVMELYEHLVEPDLVNPTFVCDFPEVAQPLARRHRSKPGLIEAWDLIIGGVERATGFNELIDPIIQREILTAQSLAAAAGDPEAMQLDEDFLAALELGAPPMGGMGMGIDRLIMLFTDAGIRETILFPLLRPQA
ncbi:MAG: lysine--tRNA ligase [Propionibacterium sp.]|nr:lysine--tRNA ligase [Brooklawnia sp. SH051]MEA5120554.1 lysine--tRNA ligase [Propionibacterium sp.]